jgi:uncharacterized glyoxalase superfamily protein PhnB
MACTCCGRERRTQALPSRADVELCQECVDWLAGRLGVSSTPTLPVLDLDEAVRFYEAAGFGVRRYAEDPDDPGEGFAFVDADGQSVFDLDRIATMDPVRNGAGCYLVTGEADEWHERMRAAGLPVTDIEDQPWGMREYTLTDPFGNRVRIGRSSDEDD